MYHRGRIVKAFASVESVSLYVYMDVAACVCVYACMCVITKGGDLSVTYSCNIFFAVCCCQHADEICTHIYVYIYIDIHTYIYI